MESVANAKSKPSNLSIRDYQYFYHFPSSIKTSRDIDAIFIPTRHQAAYLSGDISRLSELTEKIHFILPDQYSTETLKNESFIKPSEDFLNKFSQLSHHKFLPTLYKSPQWQLPIKRNYAIYYSLQKRYKTILIIDDDQLIKPDIIAEATKLLNDFCVVSFPSIDYPDKSAVGHIARSVGLDNQVFLSGACLLINISEDLPFFPSIYNEDWFFFLAIKDKVAFGGNSKQLPYDPFTIQRIKFQEMGDFIAEAYLEAISNDNFGALLTESFWRDKKDQRQKYLLRLKKVAFQKRERHVELLEVAMDELDKVDILQCLGFMDSLSKDYKKWQDIIADVSEEKTRSLLRKIEA